MLKSDKNKAMLTKADFMEGFRESGLKRGAAVLVHTSLSSLGFVCGGAQTVIEALLDTVGEEGTIMMPSQSWKNLDPEMGVHGDLPKEWYSVIRESWPAYDPDITPSNNMGAAAEMFRSWPGAIRSSHPARSVAAVGKYAAYLTENHDLSNIFGAGYPIDRLYQLDGEVLLIGVGYDKNTSLHLADTLADYPGKHNEVQSSAVNIQGCRQWISYETLAVDGEDFQEIGEAFEAEKEARIVKLGNAELRLMKQRELVDFAVKWIEKYRK